MELKNINNLANKLCLIFTDNTIEDLFGNTLEKGDSEYENLKTAENIAKVTLTSLTQQEKVINIKETCDKYRNVTRYCYTKI